MRSNILFLLEIECIQSCLMAEVKDSSWLWRFCYGHLSFWRFEDTPTEKHGHRSKTSNFLLKSMKNVLLANKLDLNFPNEKS